jgi:hypothetical protein
VGNQIIVSTKDYECAYNSKTGLYDSLKVTNYLDTSIFGIQGNTLTIFGEASSYPSTAKVQIMVNMTRVGSGSGLQGQWKENGFTYQVLSGVLDSSSRKELDDEIALNEKILSYGTREYAFSADSLTGYQDVRYAEYFVAGWNGAFDISGDKSYSDSARYDITLQVADKNTVVFKGIKNGETVHMTRSQNGDRTYVSDSSAHAEYHYYANQTPQTCPTIYQSSQPSWWYTFLSANLRSTATLAKAIAKPGVNSFRHPLIFEKELQQVERK